MSGGAGWRMKKSYCVYIITNKRNGTLYIGITSNLPQRVMQHKSRAVPGFASRYGLDRLVWFEIHGEVTEAIARASRGAAEPATRARVSSPGPTPGSSRAMRKPDILLRGLSAQRSTHRTSLTCAASRNLSPPNLTNGMPRRASSSSSCALWPELRNSTACDFSATPFSR